MTNENSAEKRIAQLSTVGIGLLLGAALGVIIPEVVIISSFFQHLSYQIVQGVESIYKASDSDSEPTRTVAIALVSGFMLMLIVEQLLIPSPDSTSHEYALASSVSSAEAARSTSNLHRHSRSRADAEHPRGLPASDADEPVIPQSNYARARSITLGLVIHSLADGLALGASSYAASTDSKPHSPIHDTIHHVSRLAAHFNNTLVPNSVSASSHTETGSKPTNPLTLVVFMALIIHKIPTALALATSLLSLIPAKRIRLHVAAFSIATPIGALVSFVAVGLFETMVATNPQSIHGKSSQTTSTSDTVSSSSTGRWAGIALAFSGGTFLYVATVLQPVKKDGGHHGHVGEDEIHQLGKFTRSILIILGMLIPIWVTMVVGHGH